MESGRALIDTCYMNFIDNQVTLQVDGIWFIVTIRELGQGSSWVVINNSGVKNDVKCDHPMFESSDGESATPVREHLHTLVSGSQEREIALDTPRPGNVGGECDNASSPLCVRSSVNLDCQSSSEKTKLAELSYNLEEEKETISSCRSKKGLSQATNVHSDLLNVVDPIGYETEGDLVDVPIEAERDFSVRLTRSIRKRRRKGKSKKKLKPIVSAKEQTRNRSKAALSSVALSCDDDYTEDSIREEQMTRALGETCGINYPS